MTTIPRRRSGAVATAVAAGLLALTCAALPGVAQAAPAPLSVRAPALTASTTGPAAVRAARAGLDAVDAATRLATQRHAPARVDPRAVVGNGLERGQTLRGGDSLQSPSGRWSLVLDTDGTLLVQKAANRLNPSPYALAVTKGPAGSRLAMQADGNLVLYTPDDAPVFASGTAGSAAVRLVVQDDGRVVLRAADGAEVYAFPSTEVVFGPGGTLLPGEQLSSPDGGTDLVMQQDGNLVLYTGGVARFATGTFSAGAAAVQQADGNFVVYAQDGRPLFATGTANGQITVLVVTDREFRLVQLLGATAGTVFGSEWGSGVVEPGMFLIAGDRRSAPGGVQLVLQTDGNLVEYVAGQPVLATYTEGPDVAIMQEDGNFVVYGEDGDTVTPLFDTGTAGFPGSVLAVQSDTNLVVYTPEGRPVFSAL